MLTPCAVISRATTPQQRIHRTTIAELAGAPPLAAPTLLVVGEVVRFADPVVLAQEFGMPAIADGNALPLSLFADSSSVADFGTNEEPLG